MLRYILIFSLFISYITKSSAALIYSLNAESTSVVSVDVEGKTQIAPQAAENTIANSFWDFWAENEGEDSDEKTDFIPFFIIASCLFIATIYRVERKSFMPLPLSFIATRPRVPAFIRFHNLRH